MSASPDSERIAKLPLWAQRHIDILARKVADQQAILDSLSDDNPSTFWFVLGSDFTKHPIPPDAIVRFRTGTFRTGTWSDSEYADVSLRDGRIRIMSGTTVAVYPQSTNCVEMRCIPWLTTPSNTS